MAIPTFSCPKVPQISARSVHGTATTFADSMNVPQEDPSFKPLHDFLEHTYGNNEIQSKAELIVFDKEGFIINNRNGDKSSFSADLDDISLEPDQSGLRKLLLLENLTPDWIKVLHERWNVPHDFFLSHVEHSDWYTLQNIQEHLPVLCSAPPEHFRIQFVVAREIDVDDEDLHDVKHIRPLRREMTTASIKELKTEDPKRFSGIKSLQLHRVPDDIQEVSTAAVPRIAGGFNPTPTPVSKNGRHDDPYVQLEQLKRLKLGQADGLKPFACIRNTINFWFDNSNTPKEWRNAVILFYPPFKAANRRLNHMSPSIYRPFLPAYIPPELGRNDFESRESHMKSFLFCLRFRHENIANNSGKHKAVPITDSPFDLLHDLWRIIASESLVFDTYAERSLNNIEKFFETLGEDCGQEDLHFLLSQLMKIQRRITKYSALVTDAIDAWPNDWKNRDRSVHRNYLENPSPMLDFQRLLNLFEHKQARISHAINVVTSLMGIHQGQLSERRNETLFILTMVTSILLPFTTVASIMAIPGDGNLDPSKRYFWIFWTAAVILLAVFTLVWLLGRFAVKPLYLRIVRQTKLLSAKRRLDIAQASNSLVARDLPMTKLAFPNQPACRQDLC